MHTGLAVLPGPPTDVRDPPCQTAKSDGPRIPCLNSRWRIGDTTSGWECDPRAPGDDSDDRAPGRGPGWAFCPLWDGRYSGSRETGQRTAFGLISTEAFPHTYDGVVRSMDRNFCHCAPSEPGCGTQVGRQCPTSARLARTSRARRLCGFRSRDGSQKDYRIYGRVAG